VPPKPTADGCTLGLLFFAPLSTIEKAMVVVPGNHEKPYPRRDISKLHCCSVMSSQVKSSQCLEPPPRTARERPFLRPFVLFLLLILLRAPATIECSDAIWITINNEISIPVCLVSAQ
jgi:hypothetical protein